MQIACALLLLVSLIMAPAVPAGAFFPSLSSLSAKIESQSQRLRSYQVRWHVQTDETAANATSRVSMVQSGLAWYQEWATRLNGGKGKVIAACLGRETDIMAAYPADTSSFPMPPLFYWHAPDLSVLGAELGADLTRKRYAFFRGRPCLVLGALGAGQIWLDNERQVPVRLVSGPKSWTLEFSRYTQLQGLWIPRALRVVFSNGTAVHGELKWGAPNSPRIRSVLNSETFRQRFNGFAPPKDTDDTLELFRRDFSQAVAP